MSQGPATTLETAGADGTRLVGRLWSAPAPARALVVLVHGLEDHSGRYEHLATVLNRAGISVVAFDLRGHGRSAGDRAWVARFSEYGTDLAAVIRTGEAAVPGVPVVLFGHSLGGAIAARYALDHPGELRGLVLSAPALRPPPGTRTSTTAVVRFLSRVAPHARVFRPDVPGFSRDPAVVAAMKNDPLIDHRPIPARTVAELLRAMDAIRENAPALRLPLLALGGTADRIADPAAVEEFAQRSRSSARRFRSVPGAFHDLWHEAEAAELESELAHWVGALPP